jgi:hypothetical protein
LQRWFESLHNKVGPCCCAKADGQPLDDGEWDIKDSSYRVFVRGQQLAYVLFRERAALPLSGQVPRARLGAKDCDEYC